MLKRVEFPDGTVVWGGGTSAGVREQADFGLYLDPHWKRQSHRSPSEVAHEIRFIDWEDYGLPADEDRAGRSIIEAFQHARKGKRVEVLCLGGTGRTGTVLSCMAVLSGVPSAEAVDWVRQNYRDGAVEGDGQKEVVARFAANFGTEKR